MLIYQINIKKVFRCDYYNVSLLPKDSFSPALYNVVPLDLKHLKLLEGKSSMNQHQKAITIKTHHIMDKQMTTYYFKINLPRHH